MRVCLKRGTTLELPKTLNELAHEIHHVDNRQWWHDLKTGAPLDRNKGEMIALMHSELSELLEGERKGLKDKHLPHRSAAEAEMADLFIRALDYSGAFGFDLDAAIAEKRAYNAVRADHKKEQRLAEGGKRF